MDSHHLFIGPDAAYEVEVVIGFRYIDAAPNWEYTFGSTTRVSRLQIQRDDTHADAWTVFGLKNDFDWVLTCEAPEVEGAGWSCFDGWEGPRGYHEPEARLVAQIPEPGLAFVKPRCGSWLQRDSETVTHSVGFEAGPRQPVVSSTVTLPADVEAAWDVQVQTEVHEPCEDGTCPWEFPYPHGSRAVGRPVYPCTEGIEVD